MSSEQRLQKTIDGLKRRGLPAPEMRSKIWRARRRSSPSPYSDGVAIAQDALKEFDKDLKKMK